ncbi:MAG: selenocysteine-specific translation elongation factor [Phycisphaerae bacterium]|nr:selenocysteine-specific translation elongation factor [Phycisphaerae bacterium]
MAGRFFILGTAGHIDHGKSSLVKALTGTDPDRLPEEKVRGMTIELGFARLAIDDPSHGESIEIGVVDVPGHERFVRTMVAGANGIDVAMLVVAADDGVMPQTREHIEILELLAIPRGLIVLSKKDLVSAERLGIIRAQIADAVRGTCLADWPMIDASARTLEGLDAIRTTLGGLTTLSAPRRKSAVFRLAIDRVFTIHGRGTVVTGSVLSGEIAPGAVLELMPAGATCRVREVQSHGSVVDGAGSGQRAALNLTGAEKSAVERGMELATPGYLCPTRYVDARVRVLARHEKPVASHSNVRVSIGTVEAMARLVGIGCDGIAPGGTGFVQLRFHSPVVAAFGQRFIIRNESARTTIGGGEVVRPVSRRVRPMHGDTLAAIQRAASADSLDRTREAVRRAGFAAWSSLRLACEVGVEPSDVPAMISQLSAAGELVSIGGRDVHREVILEIERRVEAYLRRHHALRPGEPGVAKDRLTGWIGMKSSPGVGREIVSRMEAAGIIAIRGPYAAHRDFRPALSAEDAAIMAQLVKEIGEAGFDPPEWSKLRTIAPLSRQRARALEDLAKTEPGLIMYGAGAFISTAAFVRFRDAVRELSAKNKRFKLADVRDRLGLTRRVVQPLLEHLDRLQLTRRVGDEREWVGGT